MWVDGRCSGVPRQVCLLSCQDVFVCGTCLGHNCSVEEKLEFKKGEDVLEEMEKFCYLGDMISCYGGASDTVSARTDSAWNKIRELSSVLVGKQGLSLKQWGKIYQSCVGPVLLYFMRIAWIQEFGVTERKSTSSSKMNFNYYFNY